MLLHPHRIRGLALFIARINISDKIIVLRLSSSKIKILLYCLISLLQISDWYDWAGVQYKFLCFPSFCLDMPIPIICHEYQPILIELDVLSLQQRRILNDFIFIFNLFNCNIYCANILEIVRHEVSRLDLGDIPQFSMWSIIELYTVWILLWTDSVSQQIVSRHLLQISRHFIQENLTAFKTACMRTISWFLVNFLLAYNFY